MSSEVKKERVQMDPKYIITLTVTLLITCVVVAGLLGGVNALLAPVPGHAGTGGGQRGGLYCLGAGPGPGRR